MPSNVALLRHSLCANPGLAHRVALYGTGVQQQLPFHQMLSTPHAQAYRVLCRRSSSDKSVVAAVVQRLFDLLDTAQLANACHVTTAVTCCLLVYLCYNSDTLPSVVQVLVLSPQHVGL